MTKQLSYTAEEIDQRLALTQTVSVQCPKEKLIVRTNLPLKEGEQLALFRRTRAYRGSRHDTQIISGKKCYKWTMIQDGEQFRQNQGSYIDPNNTAKKNLMDSLRWNTNGDYYVLCDGSSIQDYATADYIGRCFIRDRENNQCYQLQDGRHCRIHPGRAGRNRATLHLGVGVIHRTQHGYELLSNIAPIKIRIMAMGVGYPGILKYYMQCE